MSKKKKRKKKKNLNLCRPKKNVLCNVGVGCAGKEFSFPADCLKKKPASIIAVFKAKH